MSGHLLYFRDVRMKAAPLPFHTFITHISAILSICGYFCNYRKCSKSVGVLDKKGTRVKGELLKR